MKRGLKQEGPMVVWRQVLTVDGHVRSTYEGERHTTCAVKKVQAMKSPV